MLCACNGMWAVAGILMDANEALQFHALRVLWNSTYNGESCQLTGRREIMSR